MVYARNLVSGLQRLDRAEVELRVLAPVGVLAAWGSPWGRASVAATARRWQPDLVHGLHVEAPPVGLAGRPAVVTIQDLIPLDHPASVANPALRFAYRRLVTTSLRRAARVIVPSPFTRERVVAHGADPARVSVVPLGVDPRFRPLDDNERERARRTYGGGRPYVVAATGPRPHKNRAGLEAAGALLGDIPVVVTGVGPRAGGAGGAVNFVGRLGEDELVQLYGGADVMVLPALCEGFGLPALEALACGVPVVCGPGTGALAYLRSGAVEVDVRRPAEMAGAVRALLDDDRGRAELAAAGRKVASTLTIDAMARATLAVYREVLAPASEPTCR